MRGYRQALEANGLGPCAAWWATASRSATATNRRCGRCTPTAPTAIFALSNTILLGALKAVRELKLRIPDDISLVSFDNYDYLDYLDPAVTRVGQPSDEIGAQAMEILLQTDRGEGRTTRSAAPAALADRLPLGQSPLTIRRPTLTDKQPKKSWTKYSPINNTCGPSM